ncbi:MAG: hypothetical protein HRT47_05760 [Candidatus Caenarcaniphilales bacterium]|nr:hypothetical protein [Candidatus Caenarcaniphilales bacterium]
MSDIREGTIASATNQATVKQDQVASAELAYVQTDAVAQGIAGDISSTKSQIGQTQSVIDNPPTIPVTESSKKGSTTTHQVDENAVKQAESRLAQLEQDLGTFEADLVNAQQATSSAEQEMVGKQAEYAEANTKLSTLGEAEVFADKLMNVYLEQDGFLNPEEEAASIDRLNELVATISDWDIDGDGANDGQAYADSIDAFLNGTNGYHETAGNREYESDYIARGEVPPWQQTGSGDSLSGGDIIADSAEYVEVDVIGSGEGRNSIRDSVIASGNNAASNGLDV